MSRWVLMSAFTACLAGAVACDADSEVQRQTRELQAAQKDVGKETKRLEEELGRAQADVARLDQKLSLARQGLTDEVLENQKQLEEALKAQDEKVRDELNHAQREAQNHTRQTEAALKQLGQTPPPVTGAAPPLTRDELRREELLAVRGGPELGEGEDASADDEVPPQEPSSTTPSASTPLPSAQPAPAQQSAPPAPAPAPEPPPAAAPAPEAPQPAPFGPPPPPVPPMQ